MSTIHPSKYYLIPEIRRLSGRSARRIAQCMQDGKIRARKRADGRWEAAGQDLASYFGLTLDKAGNIGAVQKEERNRVPAANADVLLLHNDYLKQRLDDKDQRIAEQAKMLSSQARTIENLLKSAHGRASRPRRRA